MHEVNEILIVPTERKDQDTVLWLFEQAMILQGKDGYKVWNKIDKDSIENDIAAGLQYKVIQDNHILCIFSIQYSDPHIWRERDRADAIYLHRIVVHPEFRGQKQFEKVLNWTKGFVLKHDRKFIRMDTWADNTRIIDYYRTFGFKLIENYRTPDIPALPIQNRNIEVALLELKC